MQLSLADQYYLKADDNYLFDLESAIENLNYALSYENEHAPANCLLGMVFMYRLKDYKKASQCFYLALRGDMDYPDTYKHYSLLRMWEGEYDKALKIIARGLQVKGMDKTVLLQQKACIHEWKLELKAARAVLKQAKLFSIDQSRLELIDEDLKRVKTKMKIRKVKIK